MSAQGPRPDLGIFTDLSADYLPIRSAAPSLFDDKPTEIPHSKAHFRSPQRDTIRLAQGTIIAPVISDTFHIADGAPRITQSGNIILLRPSRPT